MSGDECTSAVAAALDVGYRHIDTAAVYNNEREVGAAIRESGLPRQALHVTTKLSPREQLGYEETIAAFHASLRRLDLSFVDCYLIHWPGSAKLKLDDVRHAERRLNAWAAMTELKRQGLCRSIGVSNFLVSHLDELPAVPDVVQTELHPLCRQTGVVEWCKARNVTIEAYAPLGSGDPRLLQHETWDATVVEADRAAALLLWSVASGFKPITKAASVAHIRANFATLAATSDAALSAVGAANRVQAPADVHFCWHAVKVRYAHDGSSHTTRSAPVPIRARAMMLQRRTRAMADVDETLDTIFERVVCAHGGRRTLSSIATLDQVRRTAGTPQPSKTAVQAQRADQTDAPVVTTHNRVCTYCRDTSTRQFETRRSAIVAREQSQRADIRLSETLAFAEFREAMLERREVQRRNDRGTALPSDERPSQHAAKQRSTLARKERDARRAVIEDYEAGFDEIAAYLRLVLRQQQQLCEVRDKAAAKKAQEERDCRSREETEAVARVAALHAKQLQLLQAAEAEDRARICQVEASVASCVVDIAIIRRRDIRQHERRVDGMMQKHHQRLEQIEAEKQSVVREENAVRERHFAAERKAFEVALCMEPDLRRRAAAAAKAREQREAQQRVDLFDEQAEHRNNVFADEDHDREGLQSDAAAEAIDAQRRQARREVKELRRAARQRREADEAVAMRQADDAVWTELRLCVENAASGNGVACHEQEARCDIEDAFLRGREFVAGHDRDRARWGEIEERHRREISCEAAAFPHGMLSAAIEENEHRCSQCQNDAEKRQAILEGLDRLVVGIQLLHSHARESLAAEEHTEWAALTADLTAALTGLHVLAAHPASEEDVAIGGEGTNHVLWCGKTKMVTYVGARPLYLLADSSVRTVEGDDDVTLTDTFVAVEILNPMMGDSVCMSPDWLNVIDLPHSTACDARFSGKPATILNAVQFGCFAEPSAAALVTRVVRVTLGSFTATLHIDVRPPVCPRTIEETRAWRMGHAFSQQRQVCASGVRCPLEHLELPVVQQLKAIKVQLVARSAHVPGHCLNLAVAAPYSKHAKLGIMLAGKSIAKPPKVLAHSIEVDFDAANASEALRFLAAAVSVDRGDVAQHVDPLDLTLVFTSKVAGTAVRTASTHQLPVSAPLAAPRVHFSAPELVVRGANVKHSPERLCEHAPQLPQYVFDPLVSLQFPPQQRDVVGGSLVFELRGQDKNCTLGLDLTTLHDRDVGLRLTNDASGLVDTNSNQRVADVVGVSSSRLQVRFSSARGGVCCTASQVSTLFRCVTFIANRKFFGAPAPLQQRISIAADVGLECLPPEASPAATKLVILPPIIEPASKAGVAVTQSMTYLEGAGPKALPTVAEIKPPSAGFGLGARLHVDITTGAEDGDELDVADSHNDVRTGINVFKHKGAPVAWWRDDPSSAGRVTSLTLHLTGDAGLCPSRVGEDEPITESTSSFAGALPKVPANAPYTFASLVDGNNVSAAGLNVLMKSLMYSSSHANPSELKKTIVVMLDDGRTGRSAIALELAIESVDDPTEVIFAETSRTYRQGGAPERVGFPLLPGVRLEDPDSDNFHAGYVSIEHSIPTGEAGDHLYILSPEQQAQAVDGGQLRPLSVSALHAALQSCDEAEDRSSLALLAEVQVPAFVHVCGDRMFFKNEQIAQVHQRIAQNKENVGNCVSLRVNFFAESRFVSFDLTEYVLRCIAFQNRCAKTKRGSRTLNMQLSCGASVTNEKLNVVVLPSPTQLPPETSVRYTEADGKPKQLFPTATAAFGEQPQAGAHITIVIEDCPDSSDEVLFDSIGAVKVKDKTVTYGKEAVGTLTHSQPHELRLALSKPSADAFTALIRSISYVNRRNDAMHSASRSVALIVCLSGDEADNVTVKALVEIVPKVVAAPAIGLPATTATLVQGAHCSVPVFAQAHVTPPAGQTTFFPGARMTVDLCASQLWSACEYITIQSATAAEDLPATEVSISDDALYIHSNGIALASAPLPNAVIRGAHVYSRLVLTATAELSTPMVTAVLRSIAYVNCIAELRGTVGRDVMLTVSARESPVFNRPLEARATVAVATVPPLVTLTSGAPMYAQCGLVDAVPVLSRCRVAITPEASFLELRITLRSQAPSDELVIDEECETLLDAAGGITSRRGAQRPLEAVGSPGKSLRLKKPTLGTFTMVQASDEGAGFTELRARFDPLSAASEAALASLVGGVCFKAAAQPGADSRDVGVDVSLSCAYGCQSASVTIHVHNAASSVSMAR